MAFVVETMRVEDVPEVQRIEREAFQSPWSARAYEQELTGNRLAHYVVARYVPDATDGDDQPARRSDPTPRLTALRSIFSQYPSPNPPRPGRIVGYGGMWVMMDEAHVTTLAVDPLFRGRGVGELVFCSLIDYAIAAGAERVTLEVRVSNRAAQCLYEKYGFSGQGVRRRYYSDDGEDALIMWSEVMSTAEFKVRLHDLHVALEMRLCDPEPRARE